MDRSHWGLLVLDKPSGITSHTAVQRVRRALAAPKAGHSGTLDPLASGVLLVALGRATRLVEYLVGDDKSYRARIRLGQVRDTLDREGTLLETRPVPPAGRADVETALERFRGSIVQIPPVHSAIKVGGEPLHRKARRGEKVAAPPRTVQIHRLELVAFEPPDVIVDLTCSKGTYVRSLARDLGQALGTVGCLWELTRTRSGAFGMDEAVALADVEDAGRRAWSWVLPAAHMVGALPRLTVEDDAVRVLGSGRELALEPGTPEGSVAVFDSAGGLVCVARVLCGRLRPQKVFSPSP